MVFVDPMVNFGKCNIVAVQAALSCFSTDLSVPSYVGFAFTGTQNLSSEFGDRVGEICETITVIVVTDVMVSVVAVSSGLENCESWVVAKHFCSKQQILFFKNRVLALECSRH